MVTSFDVLPDAYLDAHVQPGAFICKWTGLDLHLSQLLKGHPPDENEFYRNQKLHDVRYGNLFDGDVTYSFIGFNGAISVINWLNGVCTSDDGRFSFRTIDYNVGELFVFRSHASHMQCIPIIEAQIQVLFIFNECQSNIYIICNIYFCNFSS